MDKLWKAVERRIAKQFGTTRTPLSGSNSGGTQSDTLHPRLYIEIKSRKRLPKWFTETVDDTKTKAMREYKIPLTVFHQKGSQDDYVVLNVSDIILIAEEIKDGGLDN